MFWSQRVEPCDGLPMVVFTYDVYIRTCAFVYVFTYIYARTCVRACRMFIYSLFFLRMCIQPVSWPQRPFFESSVFQPLSRSMPFQVGVFRAVILGQSSSPGHSASRRLRQCSWSGAWIDAACGHPRWASGAKQTSWAPASVGKGGLGAVGSVTPRERCSSQRSRIALRAVVSQPDGGLGHAAQDIGFIYDEI